MKYLFALILILSGMPLGQLWGKESISGIVRIIAYVQRPDHDAPWRTKRIEEDVHMGTLVAADRILVSGYAAGYAKHFELQTLSSSKRIPLRLSFVDYNANLALLEPVNESLSLGIEPIRFGDDLRVGDAASLLTARQGQKLIEVPIRVRDIALATGAYSSYGLPHYTFKTQERGGGWSEPLVKGSRLVGMTVSKESDQISALPSSVIQRFLQRSKQRPYSGYARLGIHYRSLSSRVLRRYVKAGKSSRGVWVSQVKRRSPYYGKVKEGDILTNVGRYNLDDQGYIQHARWGKIAFAAVMHEYEVGSELALGLFREGKKITVRAVLRPYEVDWDLIPAPMPGHDEHLIYGGFVFQKLTESYLHSWGSKWRTRAPEVFLHNWMFQNQKTRDEAESLIALNRVLSDEFNQGYDELQNLILQSVNGHPIRSFSELRKALSQPLRDESRPDFPPFVRLVFEPFHREVILGYQDIEEVHARIAKNYGVDRKESFWNISSSKPE